MIIRVQYTNFDGSTVDGYVLKWFDNGTALFVASVSIPKTVPMQFERRTPIIVHINTLTVDGNWLGYQHESTMRGN